MQGNSPGDAPFTPPPSSAVPTVLIVLALGLMVFAGVRLAGWWPLGTVEVPASRGAVTEKTLQVPSAEATRPAPPTRREPASAGVVPTDATPPAWSRCEIGGRVVYSDTACQGSVVKSSSDTTRAALSVVQPGASRSAGSRNEAVQQALPRATAPSMAPDQDPTTALDTKARDCAYLDARIRHLDALARQALPAGEQDRLRSERKAARDRQFALRC